MIRKVLGLLSFASVIVIACTLNVGAAELQSIISSGSGSILVASNTTELQGARQVALAQQLLQQTVSGVKQQNSGVPDTQVPDAQQQKALEDAFLLQQQALLNATAATAAQQKMLQDALLAQQAAAASMQQSNLEAVASIDAASKVVPQVDTVCDTNCAEQNALIYSKTIPDFVLVDISEQRVVFYRNGVRVLSDNCVTGNASRGHNTTVGVHKILLLDTNRTLRGSYGTAFVRYWMRFTNGGQGLHDAGWRDNFGNTVYVTNGSHGCVNLKRATAQTIYNNAYLGMYVIVEN